MHFYLGIWSFSSAKNIRSAKVFFFVSCLNKLTRWIVCLLADSHGIETCFKSLVIMLFRYHCLKVENCWQNCFSTNGKTSSKSSKLNKYLRSLCLEDILLFLCSVLPLFFNGAQTWDSFHSQVADNWHICAPELQDSILSLRKRVENCLVCKR